MAYHQATQSKRQSQKQAVVMNGLLVLKALKLLRLNGIWLKANRNGTRTQSARIRIGQRSPQTNLQAGPVRLCLATGSQGRMVLMQMTRLWEWSTVGGSIGRAA